MSEVGARRRRRTLIVLAGVAGVCALLGGLSFLPPERDLPRSEVGQRVLPAYESKTGFVSLIMVTTKEESYTLSAMAMPMVVNGCWRKRAPIR